MRSQPQFLDELRARLPASEVVGKRVRLKKVGREWKGLSPFNKERTPSLFVSDEKGLYHDFSMGEARGHLYLHDGDGRSNLSGSGGTAGRSRRPCDATVTGWHSPHCTPMLPLAASGTRGVDFAGAFGKLKGALVPSGV
jgi:hypothetical protein